MNNLTGSPFSPSPPTHSASTAADPGFVASTIYGRQGSLNHADGSEVDYDVDVASLEESHYYSKRNAPRLIDVQVIDDRTLVSHSSLNSLQPDFRRVIRERDGSCVVSGVRALTFEASHSIPHSKGDIYMRNLTRCIGDTEEDYLDEIDTPRNGLFVFTPLHTLLGKGLSAFIKVKLLTIQFCSDIHLSWNRLIILHCSTDDIPQSPRPVDTSSGRLTLQHFHDSDPLVTQYPHNQDARPPENLEIWPSALIVNFVYGCTVLRKWKSGNSIDFLRQLSCDTYYPTMSEEEKKDVAVKKPQDDADRAEHRARLDFEAPDGEDQEMSMSEIMDVVMAISQNKLPRRPEDDSRERVQDWLHTL